MEFGIVWYTILPTICVKLLEGRPEFYRHRISSFTQHIPALEASNSKEHLP